MQKLVPLSKRTLLYNDNPEEEKSPPNLYSLKVISILTINTVDLFASFWTLDRILHWTVFFAWLPPSLLHVRACSGTSSSSLRSIHCMNKTGLFAFSYCWETFYQPGLLMNSTDMNLLVYSFWWTQVGISVGSIPGRRTVPSQGVPMFCFSRSCPTVFQSIGTKLHCHKQCMRIPVVPYKRETWYCQLSLLIIAILMGKD